MAKEYFVEEFANILATHLQKPMNNYCHLKECFEEYENYKRTMDERLESVVDKKYYEKIDEIFAEL
jgi:ribosomal protein L16 Arg81 hydroxylase